MDAITRLRNPSTKGRSPLSPPRDAPPPPPPATGDYELDRRRHVAARRARLGAEMALLTRPLAEVRALRDRRLRALLAWARERSPWHRERLAGVDLDAVTGDDLSALPVMTKADLMTHWDAIVTDPRLTLERVEEHLERVRRSGPAYLLGDLHAVASGGSSGVRAVMVWDFEGFLHHHLAYARVGLWRARNVARRPDARPTMVAAVYATSAVHVSAALARCFATEQYPVHLLPAARPVAELAAELAALQPTNLATYPSVLARLARLAETGRLSLRLRRITTNGEPLDDEVRFAAERAFGVLPETSWGTTETAPLACSDGTGPWMVVNEDKTVLEPVDGAGRPVAPGRPAERVLATNVVNRVLPVIRYAIDDRVTFLDRPNPGPWTGRLVGGVHGRTDESFTWPPGAGSGPEGGVTVHPFTFRAVLGERAGVSEYQVRQTAGGAEVLVVPAGGGEARVDAAGIAAAVAAALGAAGLPEPRVEVRPLARLGRRADTGKLRRFVPLAPGG